MLQLLRSVYSVEMQLSKFKLSLLECVKYSLWYDCTRDLLLLFDFTLLTLYFWISGDIRYSKR